MHTHRLLATELEFQVHLWEESLVERGTRSLCRWSMRCDYFLIMSFDCLCMSWFICYVTVNLCSLLCALMYRMYTVRQKAFTLYFHINFAKLHSVLIIFGSCYCGYGQSDMYCISQGKVRTLAMRGGRHWLALQQIYQSFSIAKIVKIELAENMTVLGIKPRRST